MDLCTDLMFTDPVLQRVFLDGRQFAPRHGHDAIVNIADYEITRLKLLLLKATSVEFAERVQYRIRRQYFLMRRHCDGYFVRLPAGHCDGCQHVLMFAHDDTDAFFNVDYQARSAYRHRHRARPGVPTRHRPRRTRSV